MESVETQLLLTTEVVQDVHERVSTTLDNYGHLSVEGKREAASVMGGLLAAEAL